MMVFVKANFFPLPTNPKYVADSIYACSGGSLRGSCPPQILETARDVLGLCDNDLFFLKNPFKNYYQNEVKNKKKRSSEYQ